VQGEVHGCQPWVVRAIPSTESALAGRARCVDVDVVLAVGLHRHSWRMRIPWEVFA
jgi:hypothetical protein